jgi:SAM-dependent methyltransferase
MLKEEQMSTTTTQTAQPDLAAVKARQQRMWASGNYAAVAARIVPMAEHLAEAAGLRPGDRVLDVATGSGNAALAAARYGCEVTGIDYVPELLERGRARAAAEGLEITFAEGDAEALAFPDASFDAVLSALGVMFAPDQQRAAAELVTRRSYGWRFRSPEDFAGFFKEQYGPTRKAFEALGEAGQGRLWDDLTALARDHDTEQGLTVAMPAEYLEVVATRV